MTNDRAYRAAMSPEEARDEIAASAGSQLDPALVAVALPLFSEEATNHQQESQRAAGERSA